MLARYTLLMLLVALVTFVANSSSALQSPTRSKLVSPQVDCPYLPRACRYNRQFDDLFRKATDKHWPPTISKNWCWLKAQCCAESHLKPRATSPANAKGLCQFLDDTLNDVARQLRRALNSYDARDSIEAAAVFMINLRRQLTSPRPSEYEAWKFPVASYNAGPGNVWCAQRFSKGEILWSGIEPFLHLCNGKHAKETRGYVKRFSKYAGFPMAIVVVAPTTPSPRMVCTPSRPHGRN